jgi:hypothetical protein
MKWTQFTRLSTFERAQLFSIKLKQDCSELLDRWNEDHPTQQFRPEGLTLFASIAMEFLRLESSIAWSKQPNPHPIQGVNSPATKGEFLLSGISYFRALCWGWRSPSIEKGKGTRHRGLFQIISEHFSQLDEEVSFLVFGVKSGESAKEAAEGFKNHTGRKDDAATLSGAFCDRIGRLTPR